jgi:sialidase-1
MHFSLGGSDKPYYTHATLFQAGTKGYLAYRIPTIVKAKSGVLIVFCEARRHSLDDHGHIDIIYRRSLDNGRTWEPARLAVSGDESSVGNPAPVADLRTDGRVVLLFCRTPLDVSGFGWRNGFSEAQFKEYCTVNIVYKVYYC